MEFMLYLHIQTSNVDTLVACLQAYTGITPETTDRRTDYLLDSILADTDADPDYLVVNQSGGGWYNVEVNTFKKLYELSALLSQRLDTICLQTMYSSVHRFTYFLLYEKGQRMREIESTGASPVPLVNKGEWLLYEREELPPNSSPVLRMFDLDSLVDYCYSLGIDLSNLHLEDYSIVLEGPTRGATLYHVVRDKLATLWDIEADLSNLRESN